MTNFYRFTIGEPENTFPLNPNGASKWAHLQKHDGAQAIGVVFRTGTGSVGSLVDGRVVWADWLAYPNGGKSESVNAELLEALKSAKDWLEWYQDAHLGSVSECDSEAMQKIDAAITRAESAIETPAKVMHCTFFGLIPEGGMFFDPFSQHEFVKTSATTAVSSTEKDYIEDFHHNEMIVPIEDKGDERPE
jgi:hypothetical protein